MLAHLQSCKLAINLCILCSMGEVTCLQACQQPWADARLHKFDTEGHRQEAWCAPCNSSSSMSPPFSTHVLLCSRRAETVQGEVHQALEDHCHLMILQPHAGRFLAVTLPTAVRGPQSQQSLILHPQCPQKLLGQNEAHPSMPVSSTS